MAQAGGAKLRGPRERAGRVSIEMHGSPFPNRLLRISMPGGFPLYMPFAELEDTVKKIFCVFLLAAPIGFLSGPVHLD